MLLSSHDLAEVFALADRVGIFVDGRMTALGTIPELEARAAASGLESVYRCFAEGLAPVRPARVA